MEGSELFRQSREFLNALADASPLKATAKGALPRSFVTPMVDVLLDSEEARKAKEFHKVFNERDLLPLHVGRLLCQQAGVIGKAIQFRF